MKNIINLIVKNKDELDRVDVFIRKKQQSIRRTRIKNLILRKKLKFNNKTLIDPSKKITYGDILKLEIPEPEKTSIKPYDYKLDIVYEDDDLLVLNKPSGIAVHPGPGNYNNTIVNALINYCGKNLSTINDELRPGIVHRIDKDTSGLIVVAKNNHTHENLSKQFEKHSIKRLYKSLVWGKLRPSSGKIETLIKRSSKNRQLMEVGILKGKKAITNYKTLEIFENTKTPTFSFVECKLETGRTHQIRVHMAFKKNPILGDKQYGKKNIKFKKINNDFLKRLNTLTGQVLHAKTLEFLFITNF